MLHTSPCAGAYRTSNVLVFDACIVHVNQTDHIRASTETFSCRQVKALSEISCRQLNAKFLVVDN